MIKTLTEEMEAKPEVVYVPAQPPPMQIEDKPKSEEAVEVGNVDVKSPTAYHLLLKANVVLQL